MVQQRKNDHVQLWQAAVIREQNSMGGVDLCDQMLSLYHMSTRTKRWTPRVITTLCHVASQILVFYKSQRVKLNWSAKNTQQCLDIKFHLAEELLDSPSFDDGSEESEEEYQPPTKNLPIRATVHNLGARHMPEIVDIKHTERCRNKGCNGKTHMSHNKCEMFKADSYLHNSEVCAVWADVKLIYLILVLGALSIAQCKTWLFL